MKRVLISILNWNNSAMTLDCVRACQALEGVRPDLVVVDNASLPDQARALAEKLGGLTLLRAPENLGYAGGNELAYQWGKDRGYDLLWILNNDARPRPDALLRVLEAYEQHGQALYATLVVDAGGRIAYGGGYEMSGQQIDYGRGYDPWRGKPIEQAAPEMRVRPVSHPHGASMLIPFAIAKSHGFVPTDFFLYGEETSYAFGLRKEHGIPTLVVPGAVVEHQASSSFVRSEGLKLVQSYYRARNDLRFAHEHLGYHRHPLARPWLAVSSFIKLLAWPFLEKPRRYALWGILHFALGVKGKTIHPEKYL